VVILKINIKYTFLVRFHIFSRNDRLFKTVLTLLNNFIKKKCWDALIWVMGHCNRAAVSRNRYGVEKTVDTHKILINAIK
jgi:hypothetical protein